MITFATSNSGKYTRFCQELAPYGLAARQQPLQIDEPQEISISEVARHKAAKAFELVRGPVVVEDSGLCIPALNNFPEALTKPVLERVGIEGFLKMLEGIEDRSCYFISALAYADCDGTIGSIVSTHERGTLLRSKQGDLHAEAWSALSYIFMPDGFESSMAAMDRLILDRLYETWRPHNIFAKFAQLASTQPEQFGLSNAA